MACKDIMAAYVQQLLELDEGKQRATLDSLSKYAENKTLDSNAKGDTSPSFAESSGSEGSSGVETPPGLGPDTAMGLAPNMLPPGLPSPGEWGAHARVRNFKQAFPSPAKVPTVTAPAGSVSNHRELRADEVKYIEGAASPKAMPNPAPGAGGVSERTQPNQQDVNALEKALNDLVSSLPPRAAAEAQEILTAVAGAKQDGPLAELKSKSATKWLMEHLEKQQAASIQKLTGFMHTDQQSPTTFSGSDNWVPSGEGWAMPMAVQDRGLANAESMQARWALGQNFLPGSFRYMSPPAASWLNTAAQNVDFQMQLPLAAHSTSLPQQLQGSRASFSGVRGGRRSTAVQKPDPMTVAAMAQAQNGETLRMHLQSLLAVEPTRVLLVRKINRLGFASTDVLEKHYSWYGRVERVLVAHSRVKAGPMQGSNCRLRPAGLGFVVMARSEDAQRVLSEGPEQMVQDVVIRVQQFERRMSELGGDGEEVDEQSPDTNSAEEQSS